MNKPRFEVLDGLRGVAAILVVWFHISECFSYDPVDKWLNHGFLAVDFFFVLSGFVISYSYDDRWGKTLNTWSFFRRRLIRLHPLVILSALIGLFAFYFSDCATYAGVTNVRWYVLLGSVLLSALLIPQPAGWNLRGVEELSSVNIPEWSLMFEYVGNILYAFIFRHLSTLWLCISVGIAALLLLDTSLSLNVFGLIAPQEDVPLYLNAGFYFYPDHVYIGMTRLCYPFLTGILIARLCSKKFIENASKSITTNSLSYGFWLCAIIIALVFATPYVGGREHNIYDGIFQACATLFIFPLVVSIGAKSAMVEGWQDRLCKFFGKISYPLYITHYPLVYCFLAWLDRNPEASTDARVLGAICLFTADLLIAYAAMKLWDEPIRAWLGKKYNK